MPENLIAMMEATNEEESPQEAAPVNVVDLVLASSREVQHQGARDGR
jgi:hypothetical protein